MDIFNALFALILINFAIIVLLLARENVSSDTNSPDHTARIYGGRSSEDWLE